MLLASFATPLSLKSWLGEHWRAPDLWPYEHALSGPRHRIAGFAAKRPASPRASAVFRSYRGHRGDPPAPLGQLQPP